MLPANSAYQDPALANNLPPTGDATKVASTLQADGWAKVNGKWTKNGKTLAFKISDPIPYSDYYTADQLIAHQLNALGFDVTVDGIGNPSVWAEDVTNGTFDTTIRWSNQGPTPYVFYSGWLDNRLSAPVGKPATGDFGRFSDNAAQAALLQYEGTGDAGAQKEAITKLQTIMTSQVPVVPLLYGGAWAEFSTRNYTGWPSASNPYMTPVPNTPYLEYTVLQLKPKS
jgi:peptide/nickel transport system substrate-binding protein